MSDAPNDSTGLIGDMASNAKPDWIEAVVTVNGQTLTFAQSMTLRCAVEHFSLALSIDGLGDDENGKKLVSGYQANLQGIREAIHRGR